MTSFARSCSVALFCAALCLAAGRPRAKKLIEFGCDEPDPAFLRRHAAVIEQSPFDGCVFHVNYRKPDGSAGSFTWEAWSRRAFQEPDLGPALEDMKQARLGRFKENFLRFNTTPADVDWFDDYAAILHNARLAGWFARQAKLPGILFDIEQYNGKLFDYRKQRDVAAQARGREVMEASSRSPASGRCANAATACWRRLWMRAGKGEGEDCGRPRDRLRLSPAGAVPGRLYIK